MEVVSIFTVTNYKTGEQFEEAIKGDAHEGVKILRSPNEYGRRNWKFVFEGFEVEGNFIPFKG